MSIRNNTVNGASFDLTNPAFAESFWNYTVGDNANPLPSNINLDQPRLLFSLTLHDNTLGDFRMCRYSAVTGVFVPIAVNTAGNKIFEAIENGDWDGTSFPPFVQFYSLISSFWNGGAATGHTITFKSSGHTGPIGIDILDTMGAVLHTFTILAGETDATDSWVVSFDFGSIAIRLPNIS